MNGTVEKPLDRPHGEGSKIERTTIYLTDVKIWNPPGSLVINNAYLALRIDTIDGFIWGVVGLENGIQSS